MNNNRKDGRMTLESSDWDALSGQIENQSNEATLLAVLREGSQHMRGVETIGRWDLDELEASIADRIVTDGPFGRDLPDGRRQFYAFVRERCCPDCQGLGEHSKVYVTDTIYSCSNGHSWTISTTDR